jgi:hypothetical protein
VEDEARLRNVYAIMDARIATSTHPYVSMFQFLHLALQLPVPLPLPLPCRTCEPKCDWAEKSVGVSDPSHFVWDFYHHLSSFLSLFFHLLGGLAIICVISQLRTRQVGPRID